MYAIYGDIYHQYTPNVSIYTSTMDPMGSDIVDQILAMDEAWAVLELPLEAQNRKVTMILRQSKNVWT